ncbi:hypothetical protein R3X27_07350 [Tropicimonas sp. TH_r6]|uniref:hypothetical protein n=1 Tax=Tropicimonas sp. TH_r6 TaxID=3082085 RepID=UPI0029540DF7|nr:hypothetical protein [Tropicimonas sp. TH_r6]MDV7142496.1 hypothetical protein [Tropicimonas sp. TH_r6]
MQRLFALALLALPAQALADTPLSAEAFDALTLGRTLHFYSEGRPYGAERYEENREVTWTFLDGECKKGRWYPQEELICFVYEGGHGPQCWSFFARGDGLRALFEDREGETELYDAGETDEPLSCLGPRIGV